MIECYLTLSSTEKWIESSHDLDGPLYWITMSMLLHSREQWLSNRLYHLKRLIILAQARYVSTNVQKKTISDKGVKPYNVYKPYLIFFGFIDGIYNYLFKVSV